MEKKLINVQKQIGRSAKSIVDNFESDDVVIINKDSYKFKR